MSVFSVRSLYRIIVLLKKICCARRTSCTKFVGCVSILLFYVYEAV